MTKFEFATELVNELIVLTSGQFDVSVMRKFKNNDVEKIGIQIRSKNQNVIPVFPVEPFYDDFINDRKSMKALSVKFMESYEFFMKSEQPEEFDFLDFEKMKDHIRFMMLNPERNQNRLKEALYTPFLDLAKVYFLALETASHQNGCVMITKSMIESWGITEEELDEIAENNIRTLDGIVVNDIIDLLPPETAEDMKRMLFTAFLHGVNTPMLVVTDGNAAIGASILTFSEVFDQISEYLEDDLYILPSSIHELIVVPAEREKEETIRQMVIAVNETVVEPDDYLSDSIYCYSRNLRRLEKL